MRPLVSIVITTKNHAHTIEQCLQSIKKQSYPAKRIEVIIVDNFSTDKTREIGKKYTALVFKKGPERTVQRNVGMMQKSHGKYVLYLDADMRLSRDVVRTCVERMEKHKTLMGLYIPEIIVGQSFWVKVRQFERSFYDATVIDCVRFIRRYAFVTIGGFDTTLDGTEDWDLDKRLRKIGKTAQIEAPLYHNEENFSLISYVSKKGYYARSFNNYIKKWGADDPDVQKQFSPWYRLVGIFFEKGKWKKVVVSGHLYVALLCLRLLVAVRIWLTMHSYDKNLRFG